MSTPQSLPHSSPQDSTKAAPAQSKWPTGLRRGPMEIAACVLISLGLLMLLQPFLLILYTWSFVTMLAGTVMFMLVSKFPE
jgi:hypothetical protein